MENRRTPVNNTMREALDTVVAEREYQRRRWSENDSTRTPEEWVSVLSIYLGKISQETPTYKGAAYNRIRLRERMIQLSAITLSALEHV